MASQDATRGAGALAALARLTWSAAAAALARGEVGVFASRASEAALLAAQAGDLVAARELALVRDRLAHGAPDVGDPGAAFAHALAELGGEAADPALTWRYLHALLAELPPEHPLIAAATALGWDQTELDLVLATLAVDDHGAALEAVALLAERARGEVIDRLGSLYASGAIVRVSDQRVAPNPVLAAACAGAASPLALAPAALLGEPAPVDAAAFAADGVVVVVAPTDVALAGLRAARVAALALPVDPVGSGWAVRDARWRRQPLLAEISAAPDLVLLTAVAAVPKAIIVADSAVVAAAMVVAASALRPDVRTWSPPTLPPEAAARALATALGVASDTVRVGHLYPGDVEALAAAVAATGGEAVWALEVELRRRAAAALAPFVFTAAPEIPRATVDTAHEFLAVQDDWGQRVVALIVPLLVAAPLALALAADRRVIAATLALGGPAPGPRMVAALAAARRWGAVLAVGIDRAAPVVLAAFARRLAASGVTAVVGLRPGTPVPLPLQAMSRTITL